MRGSLSVRSIGIMLLFVALLLILSHQNFRLSFQNCPETELDPLHGRWLVSRPRAPSIPSPASQVRKEEEETCRCPSSVVFPKIASSFNNNATADGFDLHEGDIVNLRLLRTRTTPSFIMALGPEGEEISRVIAEMGHFGPATTIIFHNILRDRCKVKQGEKAPLVIDIGAHIGYFSLYAASMGCRVLTFEPATGPSSRLFTSLALNTPKGLIQYFDVVVGREPGTAMFTQLPQTAWAFNHMLLTDEDNKEKESIEKIQVTLDDIIKEDVLLLKIDVSGYEGEVLRGLTQAIQQFNIENILCETKGEKDKAWKTRFINEMRHTYGYNIALYQEWYLLSQWKDAALHNSIKKVLKGNRIPTTHKVVTSDIDKESFLQGFEEVWYTKNKTLMDSLLGGDSKPSDIVDAETLIEEEEEEQ